MTENQTITKIKENIDSKNFEELKLFIVDIIENNAITYNIINIFNEEEYNNKELKLFIFNKIKEKQKRMESEVDKIKIINNDLEHNYYLQKYLICKYNLKEESWSNCLEKSQIVDIENVYIEDFVNIMFILSMKHRENLKNTLNSFYDDYDLKNNLLLKDVTMFKMKHLLDIYKNNYKNILYIDLVKLIKRTTKNTKYVEFIKNIYKLKAQKKHYASFKESILFLEYLLRSELKKEKINIDNYKRKEKELIKKEVDEFTKWLTSVSNKKPTEIKKIKDKLLENDIFNNTNVTENTILLNELINESKNNNLISEEQAEGLKYLLLSDEGQGLNLRNLIFHGFSNEKSLTKQDFFIDEKSFEFLTLIIIYQILKIITKRGKDEK